MQKDWHRTDEEEDMLNQFLKGAASRLLHSRPKASSETDNNGTEPHGHVIPKPPKPKEKKKPKKG
jgi:hypothetical protein